MPVYTWYSSILIMILKLISLWSSPDPPVSTHIFILTFLWRIEFNYMTLWSHNLTSSVWLIRAQLKISELLSVQFWSRKGLWDKYKKCTAHFSLKCFWQHTEYLIFPYFVFRGPRVFQPFRLHYKEQLNILHSHIFASVENSK